MLEKLRRQSGTGRTGRISEATGSAAALERRLRLPKCRKACLWHTQTRTGKSAVLKKLYPREIYVELNPADAEGLGISANEKVWIESRRGKVSATAFITNTVQKGQVFVPMHYVAANELTFPAVDPYSRQPAYKACAVSLRRAEL